jgi:hypothetical protein
MKKLLVFRMALGLILLGLSTSVGFCDSDVTVGRSGPITAFRVKTWLGWTIKLQNDSDNSYTALYAINDWAGLKVVPPHKSVKAGCILGREIPSFRFAPRDSAE